MVAHLKLLIAKLKRERFGPSSEQQRRLLDQLELQLEELEAKASEDDCAAEAAAVQRVVIPAPSLCPCCQGKLVKLGEDITETLEVIPRQWKVIQTVREKFSCRACERITQPPAPFHPISRGRAGAGLLATVLFGKYGLHLPLNRQSQGFAREGIELDVSTLADWVGACAAALSPLVELIRRHVLAAGRIHGDDTTVPVLAKGRTVTGRLWTYVRDDLARGWPPHNGRTPASLVARAFVAGDRARARSRLRRQSGCSLVARVRRSRRLGQFVRQQDYGSAGSPPCRSSRRWRAPGSP